MASTDLPSLRALGGEVDGGWALSVTSPLLKVTIGVEVRPVRTAISASGVQLHMMVMLVEERRAAFLDALRRVFNRRSTVRVPVVSKIPVLVGIRADASGMFVRGVLRDICLRGMGVALPTAERAHFSVGDVVWVTVDTGGAGGPMTVRADIKRVWSVAPPPTDVDGVVEFFCLGLSLAGSVSERSTAENKLGNYVVHWQLVGQRQRLG